MAYSLSHYRLTPSRQQRWKPQKRLSSVVVMTPMRAVEADELEKILGLSRYRDYGAEERERETRQGVIWGPVMTGMGEGAIMPVERASRLLVVDFSSSPVSLADPALRRRQISARERLACRVY